MEVLQSQSLREEKRNRTSSTHIRIPFSALDAVYVNDKLEDVYNN